MSSTEGQVIAAASSRLDPHSTSFISLFHNVSCASLGHTPSDPVSSASDRLFAAAMHCAMYPLYELLTIFVDVT